MRARAPSTRCREPSFIAHEEAQPRDLPARGAPMTPALATDRSPTSTRRQRALDLPLAAEHRPGVLRYFALAAAFAALVDAVPLGRARRAGADLHAGAPPERRRMTPRALLLQDAARDRRRRCVAGAISASGAGRRPAWRASTRPTAASTPSPTSLRERALRRAAQVDARWRSTRGERARAAAAGRALRGQEPVRRRRACRRWPARRSSATRRRRARDALLVRRLEAAGAVLVGALNMDEYAYGFTTENSALRRRPATRTT